MNGIKLHNRFIMSLTITLCHFNFQYSILYVCMYIHNGFIWWWGIFIIRNETCQNTMVFALFILLLHFFTCANHSIYKCSNTVMLIAALTHAIVMRIFIIIHVHNIHNVHNVHHSSAYTNIIHRINWFISIESFMHSRTS